MSRMKGYLGSILPLMIMAEEMNKLDESIFAGDKPTNKLKAVDIKPVSYQVLQKGCKEYFFNNEGEFSTERMRRDECVFKCVASNDKVAQKKFSKFKAASV